MASIDFSTFTIVCPMPPLSLGYRTTIQKLEGSITENYNFKVLAEQNEMLKDELESYRNQIKNLNNTISTMRIETDILDNHRSKVLQEQNEQYLSRIQAPSQPLQL